MVKSDVDALLPGLDCAQEARFRRPAVGLKLSDAQLQQIADRLFLIKSSAQTKLTKPTNKPADAAPGSFVATLEDKIAKDARFKDLGIGVVSFDQPTATSPLTASKVWLHNGDDSWRIGSTGKLAILLAALQLRDDVREVQYLKILSKPEEFDELFQLENLWKKSKNAEKSKIQAIAGDPPRPSTIFDFAKTPVDFTGPNPETPDKVGISGRLPADGELSWDKVPDFKFSELLWLTGSLSDNVAATSCLSEIGLSYTKAVQRAYGLFDEKNGMHMLLAYGYDYTNHNFKKDPVAVSAADPTGPKYRFLSAAEYNTVKDGLFVKLTKKFNDHRSYQPGSAAALTAYMIALMQDELVDANHESQRGIEGCKTIRNNLAAGGAQAIESFLVTGVHDLPGVTINRQLSKIGILQESDGEPPGGLDCEFVFLDVQDNGSGKALKYAVIATGINNSQNGPLGAEVHKALVSL